jgi:hypothetical protein
VQWPKEHDGSIELDDGVRQTDTSKPPQSSVSLARRIQRIQKGKPLKKTEETDAIFARVKEVRARARNDPEVLEISMDTKAKVSLGDYARGGKNPDRRSR